MYCQLAKHKAKRGKGKNKELAEEVREMKGKG
jgi:hypothetical protein